MQEPFVRGRPKNGIQLRLFALRYQAETWDRERRVAANLQQMLPQFSLRGEEVKRSMELISSV
jgi:hypothetical protein